MKKFIISVSGLGYVGLSLTVLLSQKYKVYATDIDHEKIKTLSKNKSTVQDLMIEEYLNTRDLDFIVTKNEQEAYKNADFSIVAVPTDYCEKEKRFDTSNIENAVRTIRKYNKNTYIIIKSTVPIGYIKKLRSDINDKKIIYSPEFLRETKALEDNLYPSRIVVGTDLKDPELLKAANIFSHMLKENAEKKDIDTFIMDFSEAEAVKLFSNTYLAMRVSFFNELDSFSEIFGLNSQRVIAGVSADDRIGDYYNNPSFGYGGYCLPKDTKQLFQQFKSENVPECIISSVVESNNVRKRFISDQILKILPQKNPKVGIYRLEMKKNSDDFRYSAIQEVIKNLKNKVSLMIYEPDLQADIFSEIPVVKDIKIFKTQCDIIVTNRYDDELSDVIYKVYTRDIFNRD